MMTASRSLERTLVFALLAAWSGFRCGGDDSAATHRTAEAPAVPATSTGDATKAATEKKATTVPATVPLPGEMFDPNAALFSLRFVSPSAPDVLSGSTYTIKLAFTGSTVGISWNLYYTMISGATTGGTQIGKPVVALTADSATWDASGVPDGTYFFYVATTGRGTSQTYLAPGSVQVQNLGGLELTSPPDNSVHRTGTNLEISYQAGTPGLAYTIALSADDGATWSALAQNLTGETFSWPIPAGQLQAPRYRLRVSATNGAGQSAIAVSGQIAISNLSLTYVNDIFPIVSARCIPCHAANGANANLWRFAPFDGRTTFVESVASGRMPPAGMAATDVDRLIIWKWTGAAP